MRDGVNDNGEREVAPMSPADIRQMIDRDKNLAIEVVREAGHQIRSFQLLQLTPDITGKPDGAARFNRYKRDQLRNLQNVLRSPFFARYKSVMTMQGQAEEVEVLLTAARDVGSMVFGDGWMLANWTSPLGLAIRHVRPGHQACVQVRNVTTYDVENTSVYEELLPTVENGTFETLSQRGVIASEDELIALDQTQEVNTELTPVEYEAKPIFGLSDIIVLVDNPQNAALALPFEDSVMIEGPPGSGKTSVGIMRIAALYDQQWDKLHLQRDRDRPFHDYSTMRILVYNEEMVDYLQSLALSIGVSNVEVRTTKDFFKNICRVTRMLSGTDRRDKSSLAALKSRRESLHAYFAGFKAHTAIWWELNRESLRQDLFKLGPDFLTLADHLEHWVGRIKQTTLDEERIPDSLKIVDLLTEAAEVISRGGSPTRAAMDPTGAKHDRMRRVNLLDAETLQKRMPEARTLIENSIRSMCARAGITRAMFDQPEYTKVKRLLAADGVSRTRIDAGDRLWRRQYSGSLPAYSELDLAMSAWLGAPLLLTSNERLKPWIGGRLNPLTHLVVDEAQDLSPSHIAVLKAQLAPGGTMTLVGDVHQNLNPHAGLRRWEDANLLNAKMCAFGVNHRQTRQLGTFLQGLYEGLFKKECGWKPSSKIVGKLPRAGVVRSWKQLGHAIANEARFWRENICGSAGATVAVLYDGRLKPDRLKWLARKLEIALSDLLVTVEAAPPDSGGDVLRKTDRVIIASVHQTKGLEFDAVVFIESSPRWSKPADQVELRVRNGFYVAASRARAGLSLCMSNLPSCIAPLIQTGLGESVSWTEDN